MLNTDKVNSKSWISCISNKYIFFVLVFMASVFRLYQLGEESFWFDESLSSVIALQPLDIAIHSLLEEGLHHSPLYYILLRPFAAGGFNEFNIRFMSVIFGVLAVPLLAQLGKVLGNSRIGILAATILVISPFHVWYSREARMYSLLAMEVIGSMLFFCKCVFQDPSRRNWLGLTFFTALGINTHHFAFFIPLVQFIFILITFKQNYSFLRYWAGAQFIAGLSLLPWLIIVLDWGHFYGSSARSTLPVWSDIPQTFWNFSVGYTENITLFVVVALSLFLLTLMFSLRSISQKILFLILWLIVPPIVTLALSFKLPLYMDRYLIVAFPAFLLLLSVGIHNIQSQLRRSLAAILLICSLLIGLNYLYFDRDVYNRADWRAVGTYLAKNVDIKMDTIFTLYYQDLISLHFYYDGPVPIKPIISFRKVELPESSREGENLQRRWLIIPHPNFSAHLVGHCQEFDFDQITTIAKVKEWYIQQYNRLTEVKEFNCVRVEIYE